ncbi:MAG: hypothetical protein ACTHKC_09570 [Candidatus Nitrosocosmicus sp.]
MINSDAFSVGYHLLCSDKACECGCYSKLIRAPSEEIQEDSSYMEGTPGPE